MKHLTRRERAALYALEHALETERDDHHVVVHDRLNLARRSRQRFELPEPERMSDPTGFTPGDRGLI